MFNFFNCGKDIFDQVIDDITSLLTNGLKFKDDSYILQHAVKKWIKDNYKSNILGNITIIIHFSVSQEFQYVYNITLIYNNKEEIIKLNTSNKIVDINLLPLEMRKELILNSQLTMEK